MPSKLEIPNSELLSSRAMDLLRTWAEQDPTIWDEMAKRLFRVLNGLQSGRMRVATSNSTCSLFVVPPIPEPHLLHGAFIVALTVIVNSPEAWPGKEDWTYYKDMAQRLSEDIRRRDSVASSAHFCSTMEIRGKSLLYFPDEYVSPF